LVIAISSRLRLAFEDEPAGERAKLLTKDEPAADCGQRGEAAGTFTQIKSPDSRRG
jgi:hypothetical protein